MSKTIDERVVSMQFDNKQFESNVATTMSTIDKFKQSLKFTDSSQGLNNVNKAVKGIDMSGLGSAVETVRTKFSALEVMGVTALVNITNSAVNAGKRIVSALTIDPVKTGLQEYETQINAVQTILANTESKGSTLTDVNKALDELNTYADKTIYNFTEMTRNIGTFTAAGADLDTSVKSIQGIANIAAISGSSSQQTSTAMYQLSQALASGKVNLQDWNSVVNAGMGGQVFQDALKRTAKTMGTDVDALIEKYGSFRESLSKGGWLTADVLTKTLEQFTMSAKEGSEEWEKYKASLKEQGYTDKQAEEILKMANTATDAATKVKTFTQLWDTLKETAQSGWTQTWEILIGDFEEAKKLWSGIYETISPMIEASAKARNELLQGWADAGGRQHIIDSLYNTIEGISNIVKPIKEAFREIFPPTTSEQLVKITEGLKNLTEGFKKSFGAGSENADKLKRAFKGLFAGVDIIIEAFKAVFKAISPIFGGLDNLGGGILDLAARWGDWMVSVRDSIEELGIFDKAVAFVHTGIAKIKSAIGKMVEFFAPVLEGVKEFGKSLGDTFTEVADNAEGRFAPLKALGEVIKNIFVALGGIIAKVAPWIFKAAKGIGNMFKSLMDTFTSSIQDADYDKAFDIFNSGVLAAMGVFIAKFMKSGSDILDNAGGFLENINDILSGVSDALGAFTQSLKAKTLLTIASAIGILTISLIALSLIDSEKLNNSIGAVTAMLIELMAALSILTKITGGMELKGMVGMLVASKAITSMAKALIFMAIAMKILSSMSWDEIGRGLTATAGGLGIMVLAVNLLPQKRITSAAKAISKMSFALVIFAAAMKIMATMSWNEIAKGLVASAVGMGILVAAVNLLPKGLKLQALAISTLAFSMIILAGALKIMATMSWDEIGRGLTVLAGSLAAIVISMKLIPKSLPLIAAGLLIVTASLIVLVGALKIMATMSWDEIGRGLVVLAGSLIILAAAMHLMKGAVAGALAMLIVAPAILVLAGALKVMGSMSWSEIIRGLVTLAGTFIVVGVAGLLLKPLIPTLLGLSVSLVMFGAACLAIGAGAVALGVGLTVIAASGSAAAVAIVAIVSGLLGLIPFALEQIGLGIVRLFEAIAGSASTLCEAVKIIILALVDALVESVPALANGALELILGVLDALVEYTPDIIDRLFQFVVLVLEGVAKNLPSLVSSIANVLTSLFSSVIDALGDMDFETVVKGLASVGIMAGIMAALSAVSSMTPGAMVGVLGMAAVVAEIGVLIAAFGGLAQIPGFQWLIDEGGDLLESIGTAIGKFAGGIVGGVFSGMTSELPEVGKNIRAFIDSFSGVDSSALDGAKAITDTLIALAGANIIDAIGQLLGGQSIEEFSAQLIPFGESMVEFSDILKDGEIDSDAVSAAASAGSMIADLAKNLPNEGGALGLIMGENNIDDWGKKLPAFGKAMVEFSDTLTEGNGIDKTAIDGAASAADVMVALSKEIPNEGGVLGWIMGENNIDEWAARLPKFGEAMVSFSDTLAGATIDQNAISAAASSAELMVALSKEIPNEGGVLGWIMGENNIDDWAEKLPAFGEAMVAFSDSLTKDGASIDQNAINAASTAAQVMIALSENIPEGDGAWDNVKEFFTGSDDIEDFADQFIVFGEGIVAFSDTVKDIDNTAVIAAARAGESLVGFAAMIAGNEEAMAFFSSNTGAGNTLSSFGTQMASFGVSLSDFSETVKGSIDQAAILSAVAAGTEMLSLAKLLPESEDGISLLSNSTISLDTFGSQISSFGTSLVTFSKTVSRGKGISQAAITRAVAAGTEMLSLANALPEAESTITMLSGGTMDIATFGKQMASYGLSIANFSKTVSKGKGINSAAVTAAANAGKDMADLAKSLPEAASLFSGKISIATFGMQMASFGLYIKKYSEQVAGINTESVSATSKVVRELVEVAKDASNLDAKGFASFGKSLGNLGKSGVDAFVKAFSNGKKRASEAAVQMLTSFVKGIESRMNLISSAFNKTLSKAISAIRSKYSTFSDAGSYLVSGFASGISANSYKAEAKARAMAKAAAEAAEDELGIESPSKVGYGIGDFFGIGFINAIGDSAKSAYKAGSNMAASARDGLSNAISKVTDYLNGDMDSQPTIRPVLDLSNVETGISTMNGMFALNPVGVMANVGTIHGMMNRRSQNGVNDDVVSAIDKLRKDVGSMERNSYNINGISYERGSEVAEAIETIVRAATKERRT